MGVVWTMDTAGIPDLDAQEEGYNPIEVRVEVEDHGTVTCRTYVQSDVYDTNPGRPSPIYKMVIMMGAKENGFPRSYIDHIKSIEDNGRTDSEMAQVLDIELNSE